MATGKSTSASASGETMTSQSNDTSSTYYDKGSVELAVETPIMHQRLETRRTLTEHHGGGSSRRRNSSRSVPNNHPHEHSNCLDNDDANSGERLMIVLVGLPARGKSFIARKLSNYMLWRGNQCRTFNVGQYRRKIATPLAGDDDNTTAATTQQQTADFFDDSNIAASKLRQEAAQLAIDDALSWLHLHSTTETAGDSSSNDSCSRSSSSSHQDDASADLCAPYVAGDSNFDSHNSNPDWMSYSARRQFHRIAIFDATNTTNERRQWILQECAKADHRVNQQATSTQTPHHRRTTGVLFLESICDDKELVAENFRVKIASCPDFENMTPEQALADLKLRIAKYEARYETITDKETAQNSPKALSYIKIFNLSSRLTVNHVYGRLAKVVLPAIMAWNTGSRPIYLCRAGETRAMEAYVRQQHQRQQQQKQNGASCSSGKGKLEKSVLERTQRKRSDRLGERGYLFRDALCEFIESEGIEFMRQRNSSEGSAHPGGGIKKLDSTGTSIAGLYEEKEVKGSLFEDSPESPSANVPTFPCLVMSSTMPRAVETASWKHPFPVKDVTNLNPLDMGDFEGMDLASIRRKHPAWYRQLKRDPFNTRFPGGESYGDLIDRLYTVVIDVEQQLGLAVLVSHVSVMQVLVSYFRSTPVQECMDAEIPMHTVLKFVPLRGGGWLESRHELLADEGDELEKSCRLGDEDATRYAEQEEAPIWGDSRSCLPHKMDP